jgi:hypothetical protein
MNKRVVLGKIPGMGKLSMHILDNATSKACKEYFIQEHENGTLHDIDPPPHIRAALNLKDHGKLGVLKMADCMAIYKNSPDGVPGMHVPDTRVLMSIVHATDLNSAAPDDDVNVCNWRIQWRDPAQVINVVPTGEPAHIRPELVNIHPHMKCAEIIGPWKRSLEPHDDSSDEENNIDQELNDTRYEYHSGSEESSAESEVITVSPLLIEHTHS